MKFYHALLRLARNSDHFIFDIISSGIEKKARFSKHGSFLVPFADEKIPCDDAEHFAI